MMQQSKRILTPVLQGLRNLSARGAATSTSTTAPAKIEKTVNNVTILGRVGADPQLRGSQEHPVVTFSVATHTNYKYENGDWAQRTDWHRVVVFKPNLRDSVLEYLKKGQRTMIQGKITYGEITDQQGNQKTSTSIIADEVVFFRDINN
ncbi:LOW QUALITY PROTEIN: single-stranded DNA-binding protein, mitochondrial [Drosophila sulfurigaster albostrigata]|uniref:LOW QUALITY PROTEIN: single-stranded DNA-binding protein, mitochondrial n=1 Tax=Drosophila sulfurigaster albostrigata TaxID=89887 RepID=UPI002D21B485|nr:LOW QUALITY PROTEIN: single-stranded DNA-binding protein, mitochondrial [Drosophila sulfurigaster albostrigata]